MKRKALRKWESMSLSKAGGWGGYVWVEREGRKEGKRREGHLLTVEYCRRSTGIGKPSFLQPSS